MKPDSSPKRILVVEDDEDIALSLVELFEDVGYEVEQVSNGQEALTLLESAKNLPSLIILDLMMPVMGGVAFRKEQLKNAKIQNIPVIIMSADGNVEKKSKESDSAVYMKKPVNIEDVLNAVKKILP